MENGLYYYPRKFLERTSERRWHQGQLYVNRFVNKNADLWFSRNSLSITYEPVGHITDSTKSRIICLNAITDHCVFVPVADLSHLPLTPSLLPRVRHLSPPPPFHIPLSYLLIPSLTSFHSHANRIADYACIPAVSLHAIIFFNGTRTIACIFSIFLFCLFVFFFLFLSCFPLLLSLFYYFTNRVFMTIDRLRLIDLILIFKL